MHKSLPQLYKETNEFTAIPRKMRPSKDTSSGKLSRGHPSRVIAEGKLKSGEWFVVHEAFDSTDLNMDVYRSNGTLSEHQEFDPVGYAYSHRVTTYNETGSQLQHYTATSRDGRLVDEIKRTPDQQLVRTLHIFSDLNDVIFHEELIYGPTQIRADLTIEREYRDKKGKRIKTDRHMNADKQCIQVVSYNGKTNTIESVTEYQPEKRTRVSTASFNEQGLKTEEALYDAEGHVARAIEFHTTAVEEPAAQKKKKERMYADNVLQSELEYRDDETLKSHTDYESDGKTIQRVRLYNVSGEHVTEDREYTAGKYSKVTRMHLKDGKVGQIKRIILYNEEGKPYRSREDNEWPAGDTFFNESEINPKNGRVTSTIIPAPTGIIRQEYDPESGRIIHSETYREEELGGTRREETHYHRAHQRGTHPEQDKPAVIKRIEHFEEDGVTATDAKEFRTDGSVKFHDDRDGDGKWIRKVYAPGTKKVDDETQPIFERVIGTGGKLEQSTLHAHADPAILSVHKEYDAKGDPVEVTLETLDGEETLSWENYVKRKKAEIQTFDPIRLATVGADILKPHQNEEEFTGQTIITLQGEATALKHAASQLRRRVADIRCELFVGDAQWEQHRGVAGHYRKEKSPATEQDNIEKVNVLKIAVPYEKKPGDHWPITFTRHSPDDTELSHFTSRGHTEAVAALTNVFRYTSCDLRLSILPTLSQHETPKGTEYRPFVRVMWPQQPHLPKEQGIVVRDMLSNLITHRGLTCMPTQGHNEVDVLCAPTSFQKKTAEFIMNDAAKKLSHGFIPAALRPPEEGRA